MRCGEDIAGCWGLLVSLPPWGLPRPGKQRRDRQQSEGNKNISLLHCPELCHLSGLSKKQFQPKAIELAEVCLERRRLGTVRCQESRAVVLGHEFTQCDSGVVCRWAQSWICMADWLRWPVPDSFVCYSVLGEGGFGDREHRGVWNSSIRWLVAGRFGAVPPPEISVAGSCYFPIPGTIATLGPFKSPHFPPMIQRDLNPHM